MSYLNTEITREEFINTRGAEKTQMGTRSSLNIFDRFCESSYKKWFDDNYSQYDSIEQAVGLELTKKIPNWVKNIFGWYSQDQVSEDELLDAIKYLINEGILVVDQMKPVIIIVIAVGISVVSIFVISEIIWYFANQEFVQARDEIKENLALLFRF